MLKVLLIADQARLHSLFTSEVNRPETLLTVATSLDTGIEALAVATPSLVFVQSRLSGLSGEIIVRHLKAHLPESDAHIFLLSEGESDAFADATDVTTLDLTIPERQLASEVRAVIDKHLPSPAAPAMAAVEAPAPPEEAPFISQAVLPSLPPPEEKPAHSPELGQETRGVREPAAMASRPGVATRFEAELESELARHELPAAPAVEPYQDTTCSGWQPTFAEESLRRQTRNLDPLLRWGSLLLLLLIAVTFGGYLLGRLAAGRHAASLPAKPPAKPAPPPPQTPPPAPAAKPPAQPLPAQPPARQETKLPAAAKPLPPSGEQLPAFVPAAGRDSATGSAQPGWERYQDREREYKVYREQGSIKAVQIIDRSGRGVPADFFTRALRELAGVKEYSLGGKEIKGDYLVKKGRLTAKARIIIYKDRADRKLQAFVVYFD